MLLVDQIGSAHSRGIVIINFLGILNDSLIKKKRTTESIQI
jgi:hypothetical protein